MRLRTEVMPDSHKLYLISCTHFGTVQQHRKGLMEVIEKVEKDPTARLIHFGDFAEGITIDDKRWDGDTIDHEMPVPLMQWSKGAEFFRPIAEKIKGIHAGNHDLKLASRFGNGVMDTVCANIAAWSNRGHESIYSGYNCKYTMVDKEGNKMYKLFATHGFRKSITSTKEDDYERYLALGKRLKNVLEPYAGDCEIMAMGHTHKLIVVPPTPPTHKEYASPKLYLTDDGKEIKQHYIYQTHQDNPDYIDPKKRWYANVGCFFKLFGHNRDSYAETAGYAPTEMGYVIVHVEDRQIKTIERVVI